MEFCVGGCVCAVWTTSHSSKQVIFIGLGECELTIKILTASTLLVPIMAQWKLDLIVLGPTHVQQESPPARPQEAYRPLRT